MRLLYVSNGFPPHRWAGTETHTAALATEFARRGSKVQVLCAGEWEKGPSPYNGFDDALFDGVSVRRLHLNWTRAPDPFGWLHDNPRVADVLRDYLDELRPDLVHVTSCETLSASVLRVVRDCGIPLVLSLTDFWFLCPRITLLRSDGRNCDGRVAPRDCTTCLARHSKVYRWPRTVLPDEVVTRLLAAVSKYPGLTRRRGLRGVVGCMARRQILLQQALQWPDARVTASRFVRDMHRANGVNVPILVHPYGHDLHWLESYQGKTRSSRLRLGYVGQLLPSKGVHVLLQACQTLARDRGAGFEVVIYGDLEGAGEYGKELLALASTVPHVQFRGTYQHADSAEVYATIDVLVVPSLWYDFPLVIDEAFATGTPVVASRLGGMAEAVTHEVNGLLFEPGCADDLATQLGRLVDGPTLSHHLREGILPVKTIAEAADEFEEIYARFLRVH